MTRDYFLQGECMVTVKGARGTTISNVTQLGLSSEQIKLSFNFIKRDLKVDVWGGLTPPEVQGMLTDVIIDVDLVHFDSLVLMECVRLTMGPAPVNLLGDLVGNPRGPTRAGLLSRAGMPLGGFVENRFDPGWGYVELGLSASTIEGIPWTFRSVYLLGPPFLVSLGSDRSIAKTQWRAIHWTPDPYRDGQGSQGAVIWDNIDHVETSADPDGLGNT